MKSVSAETAKQRWERDVLEPTLEKSPERSVRRYGRACLTTTYCWALLDGGSAAGRKSREEHTIPVLYRDKGDEVTIAVGWPERKLWWRNLTGEGGPVRLVVRGQELRGHAVATRDPGRDALVRVRVESRG